MRYITEYIYVDLETGEITELKHVSKYEKEKRIIIIKTERDEKHKTHATRTVRVTKYYRKNKYRQTTLY